MKSKKTIEQYWQSAKSEKVTFSQQELRSLVENAATTTSAHQISTQLPRKIPMMPIALTVAGALTGVALLLAPQQQTTQTEQPITKQQQVVEKVHSATPNTSDVKVKVVTTRGNEQKEIVINDSVRIVRIKQDSPNKAQTQNKQHTPDIQIKIEGVSLLELSEEELHAFYYSTDNNCGLRFFTAVDKQDKQYIENAIGGNGGFTTRIIKDTTIAWVNPKLNVSPALITDSKGNTRLQSKVQYTTSEIRFPKIDVTTIETKSGATEDKASVKFPVYPNDSTWTQKRMDEVRTSLEEHGIKVEFEKLTEVQVIERENESKQIKKQINVQISTNRLIGVRAQASANCENPLVMWFELTRDFIALLPTRYRAALETQLPTVNAHGSGTIIVMTTDEAKKMAENAQAGCKYLDACKLSNGAIENTSVFPNPASESINATVVLQEARECTFALHYLNGINTNSINEKIQCKPGENTFHFATKSVESGMYLLSITTNKGEQAVQRVIIKK